MPSQLRDKFKALPPEPILLAAILSLALFLPFQTLAAHAEEKMTDRTITVTATGTVEAEPDQARITSGVTTEAASAREALTRNNEAMSKVIAALKAKGIAAKDIQTSTFNVSPVIRYGKEGEPSKITGYRVGNQVVVLVRDLASLGDVLDDMISAGANETQGLSFEVSNADTLKDKAREDAMAKALRRAKLLAAAAGAQVGEVVRITEETASNGPVPYTARFAKAESVPIERGTSTLEARVTVTWALN
jgi:uncharacterized protein YggE